MTTPTLESIRFAGMATCIPKRVISNLTDYEPQLRAKRKRLVRNIGIEARHMTQEWQCFSNLVFDTAECLLESLKQKREEVDALTVVARPPDYLAPATTIILQDCLGLPCSTVAFGINLGCSTYPFALNLLGSLITAGGVKKGLALVGDRSASVDDPVFSDTGTATALEFCEDTPPTHFDLNSDGSGCKATTLPVGGHREPVGVQHLLSFHEDENDHQRRTIDLQLDGTAVLSFPTQRVPPAMKKLLDYAGASEDEVDYFILHQANRMINEAIRRKLGLPIEKMPSTLRDFGNTSGTPLPVTTTAQINWELKTGRNHVLLCGFDIGPFWGAYLVDIEGAKSPDLIGS